MKKYLVILPLIALLLSSCAPKVKVNSVSEIQGKLDKIVDAKMKEFGIPSVIVGIWIPGKGNYVVARGLADLKTGKAANIHDKYRIACLTKSFTSTVILQLVDEKKLKLDDTIAKLDLGIKIPDADKITVRQLLSHSSGIFNFTADPKFWTAFTKDPFRKWTSKELIAVALTHPADFAPGKDYRYNNTDYEFLKLIIEKLTGNKAENEIRRRIINRLGLRNTSYPYTSNPKVPARHLKGYAVKKAIMSINLADLDDVTEYAPFAEGMISNLDDLKIWAKEFALGKLLSPKLQKERLSFLVPAGNPQAGMGFLYFNGLIGRSGEIPGYNSAMYYDPKSGITIVAVVNRYPCKIEGAVDNIWISLVETMIKDGLVHLGK